MGQEGRADITTQSCPNAVLAGLTDSVHATIAAGAQLDLPSAHINLSTCTMVGVMLEKRPPVGRNRVRREGVRQGKGASEQEEPKHTALQSK